MATSCSGWLIAIAVIQIAAADQSIAGVKSESGVVNSGASSSAENSCGLSYKGTTFDLSALQGNGPYHVENNFWNMYRNWNYTYVFEVCANVENPPATESPKNLCEITQGSDGVNNSASSPAYQIFNSHGGADDCYRIGENVETQPPEWSLVNEDRPALGVTMTYIDGDQCLSDMGQRRPCGYPVDGYCDRRTRINFLCSPEDLAISETASIQEIDGCMYEMNINSVYGCPTECRLGSTGTVICSGNGICGYNTDEGLTKCYCEDGWEGELCELVEPSYAGAIGSLFALMLVCCCVGAIIYVLRDKGSLQCLNAYERIPRQAGAAGLGQAGMNSYASDRQQAAEARIAL